MPEPKLRYHLKQFPIDSLAAFLPKDFAWQGKLNADIQLDLPDSGPKGVVSVDASGGTLRVKDKQQWLDFPYDTLTLETTLNPKRIDTRLNFHGGKPVSCCCRRRSTRCRKTSRSAATSTLPASTWPARPFVPMVEKLHGKPARAAGVFPAGYGAAGQRQRESGGRRDFRAGASVSPRT